jgi:RNA polymerase II-associated factor 1
MRVVCSLTLLHALHIQIASINITIVIQFEDHPPPVDPKDRPLLRPLNALGKPMSITSGVSFLRRTEYITSAQTINKNAALRTGGAPKRKRRPDISREDPLNILRGVLKGFDVAYPRDAYSGPDGVDNMVRSSEISQEEKDAWARPKHPTKPNLSLLDKYPILPDLEAFPDTGNYMLIKYHNNPSTNEKYDPRLDVALIRPLQQTEDEQAKFEEARAIAMMEPGRPKPIPEFRYEAFLPQNPDSVRNIKRKFSTTDPDNDAEDLYDDVDADGKPVFKYKRLRAYETYAQAGNPDDPWNDNVAIALHDGEAGSRLQRGAYIYPIVQRTSIRSVRPKTMAMMMQNSGARADETEQVDVIDLAVREPTEAEQDAIRGIVEKVDPVVVEKSVE